MKKITFYSVILGLILILTGCTSLVDPTTLIKSNYQVKAFLEQYPNAEIKLTHYNYNESFQIASEFKESCQKELTPKELYRFYVEDPDTQFKLVGYLDLASQNVECIKKYSNENGEIDDKKEETSKPPIKEPQKDSHKPIVIKLETQEEADYLKLIWHTNLKNVKYFKVMRSYDNADPKYPDQKAIQVIEPKDENNDKFHTKVKIENDFAYYRISAVAEDEKVYHSNVFKFKKDKDKEMPDIKLSLYGELDDYNKIELKWYSNLDEVEYYKIVRSYNNDNPKYPEDELVKAVEGNGKSEYYEIEFEEKENKKVYYRVTALMKNGEKIHSNVIKIHTLEYENHKDDKQDYELELDLEHEDNSIELKWEVESTNNIKYFKVVRSTDNDNPQYPEDGYIAVINPEYDEYNYKYVIEKETYLEEEAYYRITLVTKDNNYVHSNIEKFYPDDIENNHDITEVELIEHCESHGGWWEEIEQQCNEITQEACELKDGEYAQYQTCDIPEQCIENPDEGDCPLIGCTNTTHSYCNYGHLI
ncbi:MAG: hypothetical protein KC589_02245 [Nanoarchaeota archaeon]|nr:hypothetical protein [Nanoarchaeota archaeon]